VSVERNVLSVLFLTVGMIMTGCQPEKPEIEQPVATDLANPAAVFCVESGGTYKIHRAADGSESGICTLSDGTEVDAWDYFGREAKE
jgi:putative hemolysin